MKKSKVAVVACPDYEPAHVKESLQKGLEAIGGLESLIGKEENILLKPNLVRSAKRERAVVTDPEVMDALITILQENGYENISCGDSCGLGTPEGIAKEAGLKEVLEKHNVPLKDFLTSERVETADGKFLMIAKDALDCDIRIFTALCFDLFKIGVRRFVQNLHRIRHIFISHTGNAEMILQITDLIRRKTNQRYSCKQKRKKSEPKQ